MLWRSFTAAAAVLAISMSPTKSDAQVITQGKVDCGMWVKARTEGRAPYLEHYLVGLLNGMALGTNIEFWYAGGVMVGQEQVFPWMDNYCRREALSYVITGAMVLMNERTGNAWASFHAVQR